MLRGLLLIYPPTSIDKGIYRQIDLTLKIFPTNYLCVLFFPTPPAIQSRGRFGAAPRYLEKEKDKNTKMPAGPSGAIWGNYSGWALYF